MHAREYKDDFFSQCIQLRAKHRQSSRPSSNSQIHSIRERDFFFFHPPSSTPPLVATKPSVTQTVAASSAFVSSGTLIGAGAATTCVLGPLFWGRAFGSYRVAHCAPATPGKSFYLFFWGKGLNVLRGLLV